MEDRQRDSHQGQVCARLQVGERGSPSLSDNLPVRTNNRKWTENKFKCGEAKPELLDDWDQRLVVSTLFVNQEGTRLSLHQVAETDQVENLLNKSVVQVALAALCTLGVVCPSRSSWPQCRASNTQA